MHSDRLEAHKGKLDWYGFACNGTDSILLGKNDMDAYVSTAPSLADDSRTAARNIIEAINNLLYLVQLDAEDAGLVRNYAAQAEERLRAFGVLLTDPPSRAANRGLKVVSVPNSCQG
jgi:hypothetical protein